MVKKKIITPLLILLLLVVIAVLFKIFIYGKVINVDQVYFTHIEISPYYMNLQGGTLNSAQAFSSYKLKIKDHIGYIEMRYSLTSIVHSDGNFIIADGVYFEHVDQLYLIDSSGGKKLIWQKKYYLK